MSESECDQAALASREPQSARRSTTAGGSARARVAVLAMAVLVAGAVVLVVLGAGIPASALSNADARFISGQLLTADAGVRAELTGLRSDATSSALSETRRAATITRSLALEVSSMKGELADRMRDALRRERDWLDAVGSTLANPRSVLREQVLEHDRALLAALAKLPGYRAPRGDASRRLLAYSRERARPAGGSS